MDFYGIPVRFGDSVPAPEVAFCSWEPYMRLVCAGSHTLTETSELRMEYTVRLEEERG